MKKGVVLVIIIGIMFVIFSLTFAALYLMTQESQVAERKIRHMRVFYAAQAGMVRALELLRNEEDPSGTFYIGGGIAGYPTANPLIGRPAGIPVSITVNSGTGVNGTDEVIVTATH